MLTTSPSAAALNIHTCISRGISEMVQPPFRTCICNVNANGEFNGLKLSSLTIHIGLIRIGEPGLLAIHVAVDLVY